MTLAIVDSSSGAAVGRRDEPGDRVRRRRQDSIPPTIAADAREPEPEAGHDAEVAAAAADRPEEVGLVVGVDARAPAVGGHDLGGEQVVDRQAVLAHEIADAAAERDAADADRAGVAEADGEAMLGGPSWSRRR